MGRKFNFGDDIPTWFSKVNKIKLILYTSLFVIVAFIVVKIIMAIRDFLKDPVGQMFGFADKMAEQEMNALKACFNCNDTYDSKGNLQPPQQTCGLSGKPGFNGKCAVGMGILAWPFISFILIPLIKIAFKGIWGKTDTAKELEARTGERSPNILSRIRETIRQRINNSDIQKEKEKYAQENAETNGTTVAEETAKLSDQQVIDGLSMDTARGEITKIFETSSSPPNPADITAIIDTARAQTNYVSPSVDENKEIDATRDEERRGGGRE